MKIKVVLEKGEDRYLVASVPSLPGCHTQAKSLSQLLERIKEAIRLCLKVQGEIPQLKFVGLQEVEVSC